VQVKDIHSAARQLPAQLNLERMPAVVVNDDSESTIAGRASMRIRVIAQEVTHAIAVSRTGLRRRRDWQAAQPRCFIDRTLKLPRLLRTPVALSAGSHDNQLQAIGAAKALDLHVDTSRDSSTWSDRISK
jgi:hypothetical protein